MHTVTVACALVAACALAAARTPFPPLHVHTLESVPPGELRLLAVSDTQSTTLSAQPRAGAACVRSGRLAGLQSAGYHIVAVCGAAPGVTRAEFSVRGRHFRTEYKQPFFLTGDLDDEISRWLAEPGGEPFRLECVTNDGRAAVISMSESCP